MYYCAMEKQKHVFYSTSGHYIIAKIYYSAAILYTIYIRTWKKILPNIFDVFTSYILNLGVCLEVVSALWFGFTSYSTIGSPSNFRLPKWKMANNKHHYTINKGFFRLFRYWGFVLVLFWGNGWNKDTQSKIEKKFEAVLKLFL